ncbi:nose resistant to fluoxetine protein 6, partial [Biomphalaria glabrata]
MSPQRGVSVATSALTLLSPQRGVSVATSALTLPLPQRCVSVATSALTLMSPQRVVSVATSALTLLSPQRGVSVATSALTLLSPQRGVFVATSALTLPLPQRGVSVATSALTLMSPQRGVSVATSALTLLSPQRGVSVATSALTLLSPQRGVSVATSALTLLSPQRGVSVATSALTLPLPQRGAPVATSALTLMSPQLGAPVATSARGIGQASVRADITSNGLPHGLLVAYLTTKEISKKGWKIKWGLFYFHRFWRLSPPYMLVLLSVLGLQRFMGSGAMWSTVQPSDKSGCEKNWWTNLLYINNLVNTDASCFGHSWYLANDMQFFILSPLMLIPFYFNVYAGLLSCGIFLLAQWVTTGVLSSDNEWSPTLIGLNIKVKPGSLDYMIHYYITPYCRMGPYIVGILAGYLLAVNNGRVRLNK